jgi:hypothetical protein
VAPGTTLPLPSRTLTRAVARALPFFWIFVLIAMSATRIGTTTTCACAVIVTLRRLVKPSLSVTCNVAV